MNFTNLPYRYKVAGGAIFLVSTFLLVRSYIDTRHVMRLEESIVLNPPKPIYPGKTWVEKSPEALGLNPLKLQEFKREVGPGSFGCVARNGYLADRWGSQLLKTFGPARIRGWGSASKPYIASLLFFSEAGLNSKIEKWSWDLKREDKEITLGNLVNMTSGYGLAEGPGNAFAYNDYAVSLLFRTVIEKMFGTPVDDPGAVESLYQEPELFGALNFESENLFITRHGLPRLAKSTCDMVRFGLLLGRGGQWKNEQIISQDLIAKYLQPSVEVSMPVTRAAAGEDYLGVGTSGAGWNETSIGPGVYGFFLWFNTDGQLWPDVPHDAFQANGHWNRQSLTVIPSLDLVVAWRESEWLASNSEDFPMVMNNALKLLIGAVEK